MLHGWMVRYFIHQVHTYLRNNLDLQITLYQHYTLEIYKNIVYTPPLYITEKNRHISENCLNPSLLCNKDADERKAK